MLLSWQPFQVQSAGSTANTLYAVYLVEEGDDILMKNYLLDIKKYTCHLEGKEDFMKPLFVSICHPGLLLIMKS